MRALIVVLGITGILAVIYAIVSHSSHSNVGRKLVTELRSPTFRAEMCDNKVHGWKSWWVVCADRPLNTPRDHLSAVVYGSREGALANEDKLVHVTVWFPPPEEETYVRPYP